MPDATLEPVRSTTGSRPIVAKRIRFVPHPVTGTRIRRSFKHPRPCLAVEQTIELNDVLRPKSPETADSLHIVFVPTEAKSEWERVGSGWLAQPIEPEAPETVTITAEGDRISWRPGRVVVEGKNGLRDELLAGLVEFAFLEGEVRALEQHVEGHEAGARVDAPRTFRIDSKNKTEWQHFGEAIEKLAQLRLTFASLEPRIERGSRVLGKQSREVATKLFRAARTADRMEGLDGRLEVCEELYEGGVDRIADFRGWDRGHRLEVIIIALLLIEAILMGVDIAVRVLD